MLLNPFLPHYFEKTGLTKDKQFINEAAANRAVYLLACTASGNISAEDHELPLCKLLCGLPIDKVLAPVNITDEEIRESNAMLYAAITHWEALKNTSIDALREAFLLREEKLCLDDKKKRIACVSTRC